MKHSQFFVNHICVSSVILSSYVKDDLYNFLLNNVIHFCHYHSNKKSVTVLKEIYRLIYIYFSFIVLDWSDEGCSLISPTNEKITCKWNHLTNFALLFHAEDIDATHDKVLSIVTYIGVSLSLAGALFTLLIHIIFP